MLSPVRPSVWFSVTRVNLSKTVEVRIMQLLPQSSPMILVMVTSLRNSEIPKGTWERGRRVRQGWEKYAISANKSPYLRKGAG